MTDKWKRRERKQRKEKTGMKISGRSLLTILDVQRKRAEKAKSKRK